MTEPLTRPRHPVMGCGFIVLTALVLWALIIAAFLALT